jgi:predicted DNA-binding antitoxin AbrB/MazE fold protein
MVIRGRVHNGVVAFQDEVSLPEGIEVTVVVPTEPAAAAGRMTEEQRRALHEVRKEIESLPNESPGDTFSGADHDRVLYGER